MTVSRPGLPLKGALSKRGFTVVELLFVMGILGILAVIAIPAYTSFIQKARETAVVTTLSKIKRGQEVYRLADSVGLYTGDFQALVATGVLSPAPGGATRDEHDYRFTLAAGVSGGVPYWTVNANPLDASASAKWFYIDDAGVARFETGAPANSGSPLF
ncbi:MAG TPA: hypothetical protein DCR11_10270 [Deltaproteobacteria bacterium]|nr:hypothetical protein [Deltaproteobacteria bacterium]